MRFGASAILVISDGMMLSFSDGVVSFLELVVGEYVIIHCLDSGKCHSHIAVRAAVINGYTACCCISKCGAGETHVWHEAALLIPLLGSEDVVLAAVENF